MTNGQKEKADIGKITWEREKPRKRPVDTLRVILSVYLNVKNIKDKDDDTMGKICN